MTTMASSELSVDVYAALDRVERGEEILITREGVPIAKLTRVESIPRRRSPSDAVTELLAFRKGHSLNGMSIRELIEERRRH